MLKLLDLFCCAGGAAKGYADAGFEVTGVDIKRQRRYPYMFVQADAIEFLEDLIVTGAIADYAAVHASPPCQAYSTATAAWRKKGKIYPQLIEPIRSLLQKTGLPYVIENVPSAPLIDPITLCGSQFNLTAQFGEYGMVALRRHRIFESNFTIADPGKHDHSMQTFSVVDHIMMTDRLKYGNRDWDEERKELMGIDWMTRSELGESIPPAYTKYIGKQLMSLLNEPAR